MVVISCESVTKSQRGELTRWMLEIKTGVFVGSISATVRDKLWSNILYSWNLKSLMIYSMNNEQGYAIKFNNYDDKKIINFDGIELTNI